MLHPRRAATLLEVVVVIAIVGVLMALLLPGIAQVRATAVRIKSINNIRQCTMALHHLSDAQGYIPTLDGSTSKHGHSLMFELLPYVEEENFFRQCIESGSSTSDHTVRLYVSPADPTVSATDHNVSSYAVNAFALQKKSKLAVTFPDGLSNTIAFAEHYAFGCEATQFSWFATKPDLFDIPSIPTRHLHRATFAEPAVLTTLFGLPFAPDVYPVTAGSPPTTTGTVPGLTFQVRPTLATCNLRLAQTPHSNGMLVGLFDGSVRTLAPAMSPTTYWAAVTPAGGEVLGNNW